MSTKVKPLNWGKPQRIRVSPEKELNKEQVTGQLTKKKSPPKIKKTIVIPRTSLRNSKKVAAKQESKPVSKKMPSPKPLPKKMPSPKPLPKMPMKSSSKPSTVKSTSKMPPSTVKSTSPGYKFQYSPESRYKKSMALPITKPSPFKKEELQTLLRNQPKSPTKRGLTKVNLKEIFPDSKIEPKYLYEKIDLSPKKLSISEKGSIFKFKNPPQRIKVSKR
jgi:hypothetical protein